MQAENGIIPRTRSVPFITNSFSCMDFFVGFLSVSISLEYNHPEDTAQFREHWRMNLSVIGRRQFIQMMKEFEEYEPFIKFSTILTDFTTSGFVQLYLFRGTLHKN